MLRRFAPVSFGPLGLAGRRRVSHGQPSEEAQPMPPSPIQKVNGASVGVVASDVNLSSSRTDEAFRKAARAFDELLVEIGELPEGELDKYDDVPADTVEP
jgi:hypothetical protein